MTGASMPNDAASRARMAPDVYDFTRNFAKNPNILDKAGDMVKGIGRTFQRGIGAGIQADLSEAKTPYRPTSQNLGQRVSENQTNVGLEERKSTQGMEITSGPSTVAEEISGSQSSNPDMTSIDRDVKREVQAVAGSVPLTTKEMLQGGGSDNMFTRNLEKTLAGDGIKEIGEVDSGKEKLTEFATKYGLLLDPALLKANQQSDSTEPLEGFKGLLQGGRFDDHTQMEGGEDNRSLSQDFGKKVEEIKVDPSVNSGITMTKSEYGNIHSDFKSDDPNNPRALVYDEETRGSKSVPVTITDDPGPSSSTSKVDDFVARTDFLIGGMKDKKTGLTKSVGISLTPMNGDTAVTYNFMNDPRKPSDVTRTHFTATDEAVRQIETGTGELGEASYGQQYNKGKRRMAGLGTMDSSRIDDDNFLIT